MKPILERSRTFARWLLAALMAIGLCVAVLNYFSRGNGIDHTGRALLVVVSSLLLLGASLAFALQWMRVYWLAVILNLLTLLGLIGTAAAAYFLEASWLLALMAVGFCAWLLSVLPLTQQSPRLAAREGAMR